jgi:hypothetical protein
LYTEVRLQRILDCIWEGAIHEYLGAIGHPQLNIRLDPRKFLMKLWTEGGFVAENRVFVPFYIKREVKKRYEWVTSEDILHKLKNLRETQEKSKRAERAVVQEHDYKNILTYFNFMSDLRGEESEVRDYIIDQLETSRSRQDANEEAVRIGRSDPDTTLSLLSA